MQSFSVGNGKQIKPPKIHRTWSYPLHTDLNMFGHTEVELCPVGVSMFSKLCSGFGQCVNSTCVCDPGVVNENDWVITTNNCLTHQPSRYILALIYLIFTVLASTIAAYRLITFPSPKIVIALDSPRTIVVLVLIQNMRTFLPLSAVF